MSTEGNIRNRFPQLSEQVYGKQLVYLDNAATSLRPQSVIDKWNFISVKNNANIHRAVHYMANIATLEYEKARTAVSKYINSPSEKNIVFTAGTTSAINLVAFSFGEAFVNQGDEIVVTEAEHHSDIVPWQMMCARKGASLKVVHVDDGGELDLAELKQILNEKTKLVCVTHISNVLGIVNPIAEIISICHNAGIPTLVDGAQGIVHCDVDVQKLDCDFYVFSGHKVYAAPGTGVLYAKAEFLEKMPPHMGGGEMIETVKWEHTTYANPPYKFEAGTQNLAGTPTLVEALETAAELKKYSNEEEIKKYVYQELKSIAGLRLYGDPKNFADKIALFSFSIDGVHHEDLALILDKMGIAVRSGQMCAEPLMDRFGVTGMLRVSFAPYNTVEEAKYFISSLKRAISMLK